MTQMSLPVMLVCLGLELNILGMEWKSIWTKIGGCIIGLAGWILHLLLVLKVI